MARIGAFRSQALQERGRRFVHQSPANSDLIGQLYRSTMEILRGRSVIHACNQFAEKCRYCSPKQWDEGLSSCRHIHSSRFY